MAYFVASNRKNTEEKTATGKKGPRNARRKPTIYSNVSNRATFLPSSLRYMLSTRMNSIVDTPISQQVAFSISAVHIEYSYNSLSHKYATAYEDLAFEFSVRARSSYGSAIYWNSHRPESHDAATKSDHVNAHRCVNVISDLTSTDFALLSPCQDCWGFH